MTRRSIRREPISSDFDRHNHHDHDELFDSRLPPKDELDPRVRVAIIAMSIAVGLFIGDWLFQRYTEHRTVQVLEEVAKGFEESAKVATRSLQESTQRSMDHLRATNERARQEAERRRLALRNQRASTNQGKWLAKNCSDWRRAHTDIGGPTAEAEMGRHCALYERYLDTGIASTPVR